MVFGDKSPRSLSQRRFYWHKRGGSQDHYKRDEDFLSTTPRRRPLSNSNRHHAGWHPGGASGRGCFGVAYTSPPATTSARAWRGVSRATMCTRRHVRRCGLYDQPPCERTVHLAVHRLSLPSGSHMDMLAARIGSPHPAQKNALKVGIVQLLALDHARLLAR